jgi:transforming growth factor-beta-induced protein
MQIKQTLAVASVALAGFLFSPAVATADLYGSAKKVAAATEQLNIVQTAVANGNFNTLAALLKEAELVSALEGKGPFTVFAPTDEAFKKVPADTLAALKADPALLKKVLTYHVVAGKLDAKALSGGQEATTLAGPALPVAAKEGAVHIGSAKVVTADIGASNGIIHVIDSVLIPPTEKDLVDTAVAAGSFTTLATLLTQAGLIETLKGDGPFTVFAPTDEAFKKVPAATLAALGADKEKLKAVLLYHVVPGKVKAADVVNLTSAKTAQGAEVKIAVVEGNVKVNDANVTAVDVMASNGVIHVIDTVILPPQ